MERGVGGLENPVEFGTIVDEDDSTDGDLVNSMDKQEEEEEESE